MISRPSEATDEGDLDYGDPGYNILACQVGGTPCCNDAMVVTHAHEASTSHIGNPCHHDDRCSQKEELPILSPPSLTD